MVEEEKQDELLEESEYQIRTNLSWEIIILEELRMINRLIIEAGRSFSKQSMYMLKQAIDSWEQSLLPLVMQAQNKKIIEDVNKKLRNSMEILLKNWTVENYIECMTCLIEKKGAMISVLAQAGKYMNISTFLYERIKKEEENATGSPRQQ